jgi:hypothetical protein
MKLIARLALAGALTLTPTVTVVVPALACGNSYRYELDPKTNMLVKAEEALQEGDYAAAWKLATSATGAVGKTVEGKGAAAGLASLRARTLRVTAIAAIRTQGKASKSANPEALVSWAVDQLRVLLEREAGNPYLRARLAEGLALKAETTEEALATLKELADTDMMPDAHAWRLYAQLTKVDKERERALEQCTLRANNPKMCNLKGPGES